VADPKKEDLERAEELIAKLELLASRDPDPKARVVLEVTAAALSKPTAQNRRALSDAVPETQTPGYWESLEDNAATWAHEMSGQPFWRTANQRIDGWSKEYYALRGAPLLGQPGLPNFVGKKKKRTQES
jgi:hypothetical protein